MEEPVQSSNNALRISVFIPVYRGSDLLDELLENLVDSAYEDKEIFVIIDEPNLESMKTAEKYRGRATFILNETRIGKVEALNHAFKRSSGDILLFLDADVKVDDPMFLSHVAEAIADVDVLDIKKEIIQESFISKMVSYEFLSCNIVSYLYSALAGRCVCINGAAFAIKRSAFIEVGGFSRVLSEDFDLAVKTLLKDKRFKYAENIKVYTKAPAEWRAWLRQRKRWGLGAGLWIRMYWRKLLAYFTRNLHLLLPSLIILFPTMIPLISMYVLTGSLVGDEGFSLSTFTAVKPNIAFPFIASPQFLHNFLILFIASFALFLIMFYWAANKLRIRFIPLEFLLYYLFYQPIASVILFAGILMAFLSPDATVDWKV